MLGYSYVDTESDMQVGAYAVTEPVRRVRPGRREGVPGRDQGDRDLRRGHEDEFRTFLSESAKIPPKLAKTIVLPKWTGEVDADSVANTAKLMQRYGVVEDAEIDTGKLLQGG